MLTEKKKVPPMLARLKKKKLKKEDIFKYGTKDEIQFLKENWKGRLQKEYSDFNEFVHYDELYGLAKRLGFNNAKEAWEANPIITGGVNWEDYRRIK
jgi:hypothetical protein